MWIYHGRGRAEIKKKLAELRQTTIQINPDHKVFWVSIKRVDAELEEALTRISTADFLGQKYCTNTFLGSSGITDSDARQTRRWLLLFWVREFSERIDVFSLEFSTLMVYLSQ